MLKIAITVFDVFFSFSEFYDEDDRKLKKAIRRINKGSNPDLYFDPEELIETIWDKSFHLVRRRGSNDGGTPETSKHENEQ